MSQQDIHAAHADLEARRADVVEAEQELARLNKHEPYSPEELQARVLELLSCHVQLVFVNRDNLVQEAREGE